MYTENADPVELANARLIAAAPDLLAALSRVLPMVRACKYEDFSTLDGQEDTRTAALKNAVAVIRKALGTANAKPKARKRLAGRKQKA